MRAKPCVALLCWVAFAATAGAETQVWIEDSFADFADGRLDASGQNLYISRDGKVRTIHRFDLNQDGYLDLIFNSTHDLRTYVPATMGTVGEDRRAATSKLAVEGSLRVALSDLNRDGWLDAVFCPNYSGLQNDRRFVTILWGGEDGWPARRSNGVLPVHAAADLVVVDLNKDEWPDIAVLNGPAWIPGQPDGRILRIYWGDPNGYLLTRRRDVGVPDALDLAAADLDGDGARDLAVLRTGGTVRLFWSTPSDQATDKIATSALPLDEKHAQCLTAADFNADGRADLVVGTTKGDAQVLLISGVDGREWSKPKRVDAFPASHIAVGDLDGDAQPELVLTDFSIVHASGGEAVGTEEDVGVVRILWGAQDGFSKSASVQLSVRNAAATAISDLDGDGRSDLAAAIHQGEQTLAGESVVFFGTGSRKLARGPHGLGSEGPTDVAIAPPEGKLRARAIFANSLGGMIGEKVPLHLYWGGPEGFDVSRRVEIPFRSGYEATAADLNADGFVDLVAINSQHGGVLARADPTGGANIFWGGPDGFDFQRRRTILREQLLGTSNTADLNRDGYLDLVLGAFDAVSPDKPTPLVIHYGSADGFQPAGRVAIPSPGRSIGTAIADFNRDTWLDIAVTSMYEDLVRIFWGGAKGFDADRQAQLELPDPIALETADLNADGYLDLVVGSYRDPVTLEHDTGTVIFWGSDAGFRAWDAQRLPSWAAVGHCVADLDADGHLDLFVPCYQGEKMRETLPSFLYWGGPDGFAARRRTVLICDAGHDALAADFDRDGRLDLAVSNHSKNGDHYTNSKIFYNDGRRFTEPRIVRLPTHGPHWMWLQDMGHIYHRNWSQTYESSVCPLDRPASTGRLRREADVPTGATLAFEVRTAENKADLSGEAWREVAHGAFPLPARARFLQYRARFGSDNGDRYPQLERVVIELTNTK